MNEAVVNSSNGSLSQHSLTEEYRVVLPLDLESAILSSQPDNRVGYQRGHVFLTEFQGDLIGFDAQPANDLSIYILSILSAQQNIYSIPYAVVPGIPEAEKVHYFLSHAISESAGYPTRINHLLMFTPNEHHLFLKNSPLMGTEKFFDITPRLSVYSDQYGSKSIKKLISERKSDLKKTLIRVSRANSKPGMQAIRKLVEPQDGQTILYDFLF